MSHKFCTVASACCDVALGLLGGDFIITNLVHISIQKDVVLPPDAYARESWTRKRSWELRYEYRYEYRIRECLSVRILGGPRIARRFHSTVVINRILHIYCICVP